MLIMIVTDQYPPMVGGVPNVTHSLAIDLSQRGHQVWVIAPSTDGHNAYFLEDNVHVYRIASFGWPWYHGQRIAYLSLPLIHRLIKNLNPDILHIHCPLILGQAAQRLALSYQKPVIATNHFMPGNISQSLASNKYFYKGVYSYLTWFYNRCTYVTAPTVTALDMLHAHGLVAPSCAISNGIDLHIYTPGQINATIRRRLKLPKDYPLVLLDAVTKMQSIGHIVLVGIGPAETALRAQAERLQLGNRVSFLGFVCDDDLLALRRSSDVYVTPSESELQSLSTMEAMACGLPIIAANAAALPELVHHNENGFLFQPGNSEQLSHYLDSMLTDAALRTSMGMESLKRITIHDRSRVVRQWEDLYTSLSIEFSKANTTVA